MTNVSDVRHRETLPTKHLHFPADAIRYNGHALSWPSGLFVDIGILHADALDLDSPHRQVLGQWPPRCFARLYGSSVWRLVSSDGRRRGGGEGGVAANWNLCPVAGCEVEQIREPWQELLESNFRTK